VRVYNLYLISLAVIFSLTTVLLSAYEEASLDLYFSIYLIEYLVATQLFVHLNPRAQRSLNRTGYVLFAGFGAIVANKVIEILFGSALW
jgi:hypothetical protein